MTRKKLMLACLGSPFTESMLYKENYIIQAFAEKGYEILVLAENRKYVGEKICYTDTGMVNISEHVCVRRIKYDSVGIAYITYKIRKYKIFENVVDDFKPDILIFNLIQTHVIQQLRSICNKQPNVRVYGYSSTAFVNSARNIFSRKILHGEVYRRWIKLSIDYFDKIYCSGQDVELFLKEVYDLPDKKLDLLPLPSRIVSYRERIENGNRVKDAYNIAEGKIVFCHSGKFDSLKKTIEIMEAFSENEILDAELILAGEFNELIRNDALSIIENDERINYVGFVNGDRLEEILCCTDVYVQIGSPSQTMQTAMGCGCAVIASEMYRDLLGDSVWYANSKEELKQLLLTINPEGVLEMSKKSVQKAKELFDYKRLPDKFQ